VAEGVGPLHERCVEDALVTVSEGILSASVADMRDSGTWVTVTELLMWGMPVIRMEISSHTNVKPCWPTLY
jgi:hypothetical protein